MARRPEDRVLFAGGHAGMPVGAAAEGCRNYGPVTVLQNVVHCSYG